MRVAWVTGAASGIGAACVRRLRADGYVVVASDVDDAGLATLRAGDDGVHAEQLDVVDEAAWDAVAGAILTAHGRLDALVHAAGVSDGRPLVDTSLADWRRVLSVNLDGSFLAARTGVRTLTDGGAIVLIGSTSGQRPPPGAAAYAVSKAGVGMLTRAVARELVAAGSPVRINAVVPGGVRTPMWDRMPFFQGMVQQLGSHEAAFAALAADVGPGARLSTAEEVADAVGWLCGPRAARVHGVELVVDAGASL